MKIEFLKVQKPSNVAVSSARTCYFPNGLVKPEDSENWTKKDELLNSIFKAGHHSTLQHTQITMLIEGMSRHLIWRLLHSHSFYNSEQVSQRYAKMKIENFVYPKGCDKKEWQEFYSDRFSEYEKLIEILIPDIEAILPKFKKGEAKKKAQEMARYILPVGMSAYLYHSVNIITLLRYISIAPSLPEAREEAIEFVELIEKNLLELDSSLKPLIEIAKKSKAIFPQNDLSNLKERVNIKDNVKVFDVIEPLEFEINENYGEVLRNSQMLFDGGMIGGFNSYIKLSFSADAQNQRHRRSPAIRPMINLNEDFYTPNIIKNNKKALEIYTNANKASYQFVKNQKDKTTFSEAIYGLLNSHHIEIVEKNDFSSFHHKAQMRLCYNAQEEIFDITYEQIKQLQELNILNIDEFLPPCSIREKLNIKPICPEGNRFCGVKVWKLDFKELERRI